MIIIANAYHEDGDEKNKAVEARRKKIPISGRKLARQPQTVNKSVKREWMLVGGRNPTKKPAGRKESFPRDSRITSGLSRSKTSLSRPFRALASGLIWALSTGSRAFWRSCFVSFTRPSASSSYAVWGKALKKQCLNVWRKRKWLIATI